MKILVTALYVAGDVKEGGSSFFMKCIIDNLKEMGHTVTAASKPDNVTNPHFQESIKKTYDLIICSHREILVDLKNNPSPKICISQGLVGPETFIPGADLYYSVSDEAKAYNLSKFGIDSKVIPQPISIPRTVKPVNKEAKNVLIIRRYPITGADPFDSLKAKYDVRISDKSKPISQQIEWADVCITLGRGAIESMALGRTVIVADKRHYMSDAFGDGYLNEESIHEIRKNNYSGRRYKHVITPEWLEREINKYNPEDVKFLREYVKSSDAQRVICSMIKDAYPLIKGNDPELSSFHDYMIYGLSKCTTVLELGSGPGTGRLSEYFNMHSIEHNPEWVGYAPASNYVYAPIVGGWYDRSKLSDLPKSYDILLVDGPTGTIGRRKFLDNMDLFDMEATILFDDVNRPEEMSVFKTMVTSLPGREWKVFKGPLKDYAVVLKKGETFA